MELQHQRILDIQTPGSLRPPPIVSLVLPCYNEEEVLPETMARMGNLLARLKASGEIAAESAAYYVDDGSRDRTWQIVSDFAARGSDICGIKLSRNRGLSLGIIGEYLAKVYESSNKRPRFHVEACCGQQFSPPSRSRPVGQQFAHWQR
jgi:cellulose synthase/poly-beta-1,6-N-acetylglucosamine synthase-like glycosyltransferase